MSVSTMKNGRSFAEYLGGTCIRFHHPCGHTSTKSKEKGGCIAACPTCSRRKRHETRTR